MNDLPVALFVDDDPMLLKAVQGQLGTKVTVHVALSPNAAEVILNENPEIEVIVSDMNMPEVNGAQFLEHIAADYPSIVRVMLTATPDQATTMAAINQAGVYRLIEKPASIDKLVTTVQTASAIYRDRKNAESQNQKSLAGSLQMLLTLLRRNSPALSELSGRVAKLTEAVVANYPLDQPELVKLTSRFALVGLAASNREAAKKFATGARFNPELRAQVREGIILTAELLKSISGFHDSIPWLDSIYQTGTCNDRIREGELIELIFELERRTQHASKRNALTKMLSEPHTESEYQALEAIQSTLLAGRVVQEVSLHELESGMVLAQPIVSRTDQCLLVEETELTEALIERLYNFSRNANTRFDRFWVYK
jgi:DNA-binding NarL/FixJ family response regulator